MNTKKLLVVAPYFPPHRGGLERYAHEVAIRQHGRPEWNVVVLTTSDTKKDAIEEIDGLKIYRLGYRHVFSNTPFSLRWFARARRIIDEVSPDVIHIHTPVPGLGDIVSFFAPRHIPQIVTYHGGSMKKGKALLDVLILFYESLILPFMLRRARHIACSSDFVRNTFLRRYRHTSSTVTPGVDSSFFTPSTPPQSNTNILIVGGLKTGEEHKGVLRMIACMPKLCEQVPSTSLTIVGDGDRKAFFEQEVAKRGLTNRVTFLGAQDSEGMRSAYQGACLFVLPTTNDSFPTVILEAMASGLPVVSTTVGSIDAMVIEGNTGFLVDPTDTDALCNRILELLTHEETRNVFGLMGRERAASMFGWEHVSSAYTTLYESARTNVRTIAHVVAYYSPHMGGMEVVAERLARGAAALGYPTEVFTSTCGMKRATTTVSETNYRVHRLVSAEFAHTPIMWTLFFRLFALPKGTLIHLHIAQALVPEITLLVAKLRGLKVIAHFHLDVEPSGRLGWLFVLYKKYILPRVLRCADAVLAASHEQVSMLARIYDVQKERLHRIINGVDASFYKEARQQVLHEPLRILTVSRLTVQKRVDRLLEAMQYLEVPAELVVVGDGEDRETLEAQAHTQCKGNVQFVGRKTPSQIADFHTWADLFVIPSDKEGMPLTVLEAMAAGLPIVAADALGVTELVTGVGVVVTDSTPRRMAEAITALARDPNTMSALSAKSHTAGLSYTWESALRTVFDAYGSVHADMALGTATSST